jgi:glycosyltransferase involved in cell wall biosynthesis
MRSMKILVYEPGFSAGTETVVSHVTCAWEDRGHTVVHVAGRDRLSSLSASNCKGRALLPAMEGFDEVSESIVRKMRAFSKLRRAAKKPILALKSAWLSHVAHIHRVDAVFLPWVFDADPISLSIPTLAMAMDLRWRTYPDDFSLPAKILDRRTQDCFGAADFVCPASEFTASEVRRAYRMPPGKLVAVPHGSSGLRPQTGSRVKGSIYYPAGVNIHKNHELLIGAFALAAESIPSLSLTLSGPETDLVNQDGVTKDAALAAARKAYRKAGKAGIDCLGQVPWSAVEEAYASCHFVTFPTRYEGFGLPFIEAIEAGCRVVASRIPPLQEQADRYGVHDRVRWVESFSTEEWAQALAAEATTDPTGPPADLAERLRRWTWDDAAEAYLELFSGAGV